MISKIKALWLHLLCVYRQDRALVFYMVAAVFLLVALVWNTSCTRQTHAPQRFMSESKPIATAFHADQGACAAPLLPSDGRSVTIHWLLAREGSLRDGAAVTVTRNKPITCETLGIDPDQYRTARWLYLAACRGLVDVHPDNKRRRCTGHDGFRRDFEYLRLHPTGPACGADMNGDRFVSGFEASIIMRTWNKTCGMYLCASDLNGDGVVNFSDLALLRPVYLTACVI